MLQDLSDIIKFSILYSRVSVDLIVNFHDHLKCYIYISNQEVHLSCRAHSSTRTSYYLTMSPGMEGPFPTFT